MFLNILWCFTFFSLGNVMLALVVLCSLVVVLIGQITVLYKDNSLASLLLLPYLLWCCFASVLNYNILILNR